jgi:hypothetical protein
VAAVAQSDAVEVHVFFECGSQPPAQHLTQLLGLAWGVPADRLEVYNVLNEDELLRDWALGDASTGDARLLETGFDGDRILYARPGRTLLMTSPQAAARIAAAQAMPCVLAALGSAEHRGH